MLGCRVEPSGAPSSALARRARWAAAAWRTGRFGAVIAAGGRAWGPHVEARVLCHELAAAGVPEARLFPELCSLTTLENALFARGVMRRIGSERATLVTCDWHMPRALACFSAAGVRALPLPAPSPPSSAVVRLRRAIHEAVSARLDRRGAWRVLADRARGERHPFDEAAP